jgi:hypothetical protein
VALEVSFNEAFAYSANRSGIRSSDLEATIPLTGDLEAGNFSVTNITLPTNSSNQDDWNWIKFTVKAPAKEGLEKVYDEDGNPLDAEGNPTDEDHQAIFPLQVVYSFTYSGSDKCIENAFLNANGELQIPYNNRARAYIISNKHVTSKGKKN